MRSHCCWRNRVVVSRLGSVSSSTAGRCNDRLLATQRRGNIEGCSNADGRRRPRCLRDHEIPRRHRSSILRPTPIVANDVHHRRWLSSSSSVSSTTKNTYTQQHNPLSRSPSALRRQFSSPSFGSAQHAQTPPQTPRRSTPPIPPPPPPPLSLRKLVKPFLFQCHPDVMFAKLSSSPTASDNPKIAASAKQVNLTAIQNLNSYLDVIESMMKRPLSSTTSNSNTMVEIDFILLQAQPMEGKKGMKKFMKQAVKTSPASKNNKNHQKNEDLFEMRRKVQLTLPLADNVGIGGGGGGGSTSAELLRTMRIQQHAGRQLMKLIKVAGLHADPQVQIQYEEWERHYHDHERHHYHEQQHRNYQPSSWYGMNQPHFGFSFDDDLRLRTRRRGQTRYEMSRERFTAKIDWKRYDEMYRRAIQDMEIDIMTSGKIRNSVKRRRKLIATILSNIRVQGQGEQSSRNSEDEKVPVVNAMEQLIAIRRLSILFEEHFEELELEDMGGIYWEQCTIVLCQRRSYNTSPSALYKRRHRRIRGQEDDENNHDHDHDHDFSFTLNAETNHVEIRIPVDFDDSELLGHLQQNLFDFYDIVVFGMGDDFQQIFPQPGTY